MADGTTPIVPEAPAEAVTPGGINHLVINVRDIEESHKFWTEMLGFKQVGYSKRRNGKMRFEHLPNVYKMVAHQAVGARFVRIESHRGEPQASLV